MSAPPASERGHQREDERNAGGLLYGLIGLCVLLLLADALYHKHVAVAVENWFGFYGIFGFGICIALGLIARGLQPLLTRPDDYYDEADD